MSLTFNPPSLSRRRIEELGATALAAMLAAPPRPPRPVPSRPTWQPRRSRREQILVAARQLFETRGFHAVTVNEIGRSLGTSGSSVYRHFASKRELMAAIWDREATRFVAGTLDAVGGARDADDALTRLAASVAALAFENHALMRMTYLDLDNGPEYIGSWSEWQAFFADTWCDVLAEVRDDLSQAEVRFVVNMTHGTLIQACVDVQGQPEWVDEIANLALAFATGGTGGTRRPGQKG